MDVHYGISQWRSKSIRSPCRLPGLSRCSLSHRGAQHIPRCYSKCPLPQTPTSKPPAYPASPVFKIWLPSSVYHLLPEVLKSFLMFFVILFLALPVCQHSKVKFFKNTNRCTSLPFSELSSGFPSLGIKPTFFTVASQALLSLLW